MLKRRSSSVLLIVVIALRFFIGSVGMCQSGTRTTWAKSNPSTEWTTAEWIGDETPYRMARSQIDEAIKKSEMTQAKILQYKNAALGISKQAYYQRNPPRSFDSSSLDYFRWGYAAWRLARSGKPEDVRQPQQALFSLSLMPIKTYEQARLRFVLEARQQTYGRPELKVLARRLLKRNADDYDVMFYYSRLLAPGGSSAEHKQALQYARKLVQHQPQRASAYDALGYVHKHIWIRTNDPLHGKQAIHAYRKFLQLAPTHEPSRSGKEHVINKISRKILLKPVSVVQKQILKTR